MHKKGNCNNNCAADKHRLYQLSCATLQWTTNATKWTFYQPWRWKYSRRCRWRRVSIQHTTHTRTHYKLCSFALSLSRSPSCSFWFVVCCWHSNYMEHISYVRIHQEHKHIETCSLLPFMATQRATIRTSKQAKWAHEIMMNMIYGHDFSVRQC